VTAAAPPVLVLHDIGDGRGGRPWRDAFVAAGWQGDVLAPDLPGHGNEPAPVDGAYELVDPAWFALKLLRPLADSMPVVVGVGTSGWAAWMLALAGRAAALVLVDGIGGPWVTADEWITSQRARMRALIDDPAAMAPAPKKGLDPRVRHGVTPMTDVVLARRAAAALAVPCLVVHTPSAALSMTDVADVLRHCADPAQVQVVQAPSRAPDVVAPLVPAWLVAG